MPTLQFGEPGLEGPYPDRPAAFAVVAHDGRLVLVQVERRGRGLVLDLPGGGLDPGETAVQAAARECGEEAGLVVALDADPFVHADHFFMHNDGVVQGLSEVPYMQDVKRWGVLTIGTGLGNARYTNRNGNGDR